MSTENLLLTAGTVVLLYYCFFSPKTKLNPLTTDEQAENTLDNLLTQINQLNNQI